MNCGSSSGWRHRHDVGFRAEIGLAARICDNRQGPRKDPGTLNVTITEALKVLNAAPKDSPKYVVALACGFTPLHIKTLINARLQQALPGRRVTIQTGLYGDLAGTVESLGAGSPDAVTVLIEWPDLDPRLGLREGRSWSPSILAEVVSGVRLALNRISSALSSLKGVRVALSTPTLAPAPVFYTPGWRLQPAEAELMAAMADFTAAVSALPNVFIVNSSRLAVVSPPAQRHDIKSDLLTGLPYTLTHADALASALGQLLVPAAPKKGIITDLDDTLWFGIVGEAGPANVVWDLPSHHHQHGLYQKTLAALADAGVLVGIASKNEPVVVEQALARPDLLISPEKIFPVEVHWNAKSGSVERILKAWNISADSVVFVDDSPMELAEVAEAHPGIECILFPKDDPSQAVAMLRHLRDLFGKDQISQDDSIRLASLRNARELQAASEGGESASEAFLSQLNATVTTDYSRTADDTRVFELVNKTNQFNLNGVRYTDADWRKMVTDPNGILLAIDYEDRYGPLGTIGVMQGRVESGSVVRFPVWVMSCRAFARRIEFQCLSALFAATNAEELIFDYVPTAKNGPLQTFLRTILGHSPEQGDVRISRDAFTAACPQLHHQIKVIEKRHTQDGSSQS